MHTHAARDCSWTMLHSASFAGPWLLHRFGHSSCCLSIRLNKASLHNIHYTALCSLYVRSISAPYDHRGERQVFAKGLDTDQPRCEDRSCIKKEVGGESKHWSSIGSS